MQLIADSGSIDAAIEELKLALPVCALTNIVAERKRQHRPLGDLRRRLQLLRARQLVAEAAVD